MKTNTFTERQSVKGARIAIVRARFNETVTQRMLYGCLQTLEDAGMKEADIKTVEVPGAFEIPFAVNKLAQSGDYHAVITIGCVLRGETPHDVYISNAVIPELQKISLAHNVPVLLGIITPVNQEQAEARSSGEGNKGIEVAKAALEMIDLVRSL